PDSAALRIDSACDSFEQAWRAGQQPRIDEYLAEVPEPNRSSLLRELVTLEIAYRRRTGEGVTLDEDRRRFPGCFAQESWGDSGWEASGLPPGTGGRALGARPAAGPPATLGQYRLDRLLAQGGFGAIYLGHNVSDPLHPLAIKVLPASADTQERL